MPPRPSLLSALLSPLLTARVIASLGLLAVVVAGALGYDETIKFWAGAGAAALAVTLKATHVIS